MATPTNSLLNSSNIPRVELHLPEVMAYVRDLAREYEAGRVGSWQAMAHGVQSFFTPARMDQVEAAVPGWRAMSSQAGGVTLTHVIFVLVALLLCPEYQCATPDEQVLMEWIVLFHDVMKRVESGRRDHVHGFRSAAAAGKALPDLGFTVTHEYAFSIESWAALASSAITRLEGGTDDIQDNRQLPAIIAGIDRMFGRDTPGAMVVKGVLLHMSITVVPDWPQAAPLTMAEIRRYVSAELLPLLRAMMLADSDGWALFDPGTKERYRRQTLAAFDAIPQGSTGVAER